MAHSFQYTQTAYNPVFFRTEELRERYKISNVSRNYKKLTTRSLQSMIEIIANATGSESKLVEKCTDCFFVVFEGLGFTFFADFNINKLDREYAFLRDGPFRAEVSFTITGDLDTLSRFHETFVAMRFADQDKAASLTWEFMSSQNVSSRSSYVEDKPVRDEFYPFLEDGVTKFLDDYMASEQPILILLGPPGTGKTSLLRHMIYRSQMRAITSFEEKIIESDRFYVDFVTGDDHDLMIIEDADILISSRNQERNKIMFKFLNYSEGIVQIPQKKIVFTANVEKEQIDHALMRPGRCYAVLEFRGYSKEEARRIYDVMGIEDGPMHEGVTLAEIFTGRRETKTRFKVGF